MAFRKERITSGAVEEFGAGYHLHILEGVEVLSCDDATRIIRFSGADNPTLKIDSLDPVLEFDGSTCYDLSSLQSLRTEVATAYKDGSLEISFERRGRLFIPFGGYEAWHVRSDGTLHVLSGAGGGIGIYL